MQDLILRNRVAGYREGDLLRHLHGADETKPLAPAERRAFEHYLPGRGILVAFPIEAWPCLAGLIRTRRLRGGVYRRALSPKLEQLAQHILREIRERGPLSSDDIEHEARSMTAWGTPGRLVKNLLDVLFIHGRVLIAARRHFRRFYDLPERVLPAEVLAQTPPAEKTTRRWVAELELRQRRLVLLRKSDAPLVTDLVQPIKVACVPTLHCLRSDLPLLERAAIGEDSSADGTIHLLAPLDPLIYDRRVTRRLWNFNYTWEVYTPLAKRVRGYYALPVLAGAEIVGHVDPRADRAERRLVVVTRRVRRGHATANAVCELARFLGLRVRR